jgi:hypothetical protein
MEKVWVEKVLPQARHLKRGMTPKALVRWKPSRTNHGPSGLLM